MNDIEIREMRQTDIDAFVETLCSVIHERVYLGATQAPSHQEISEFISNSIDAGFPQIIALTAGNVVGWCDVIALTPAERAHVGRLGMGIKADYRNRGLGTKLVKICLQRSIEFGFEKIELDVYDDNHSAIKLYQNVGFTPEGCLKKARKLDGRYQDIIKMSLFLDGAK